MGNWAFDVFTGIAAMLEEQDLAAQTILRNIVQFTYMVPVGLSSSSNFLVGKHFGAGEFNLVKQVSNLCLTIAFIWSLSSVVIILAFKDGIMNFYTQNPLVIESMDAAWSILVVYVFFDCM